MAHLLYGYEGPCAGIHGHSYKLSVTVGGIPAPESARGKAGLVMDFSDLKKILIRSVVNIFDHALVIWDKVPMKSRVLGTKKVIRVPYQPTCENLVSDFADRIKKKLPRNIKLISVKLRETESTSAEWIAEENNI